MESWSFILPLSVIFSIMLWTTEAQTGLTCRRCIHASYTATGIPPLYQVFLRSMATKFNLNNPTCDGDTATTPLETCAPGVTKCWTYRGNFSLKTLLNIPNTAMDARVVARSCGDVIDQGPDTCSQFTHENVDPRLSKVLQRPLKTMNALSKSVTYNGQICLNTT